MNERVKKLYETDENQLFKHLQGLPEKIVEFESTTGQSLPDVFDYAFVEAINVNDLVMVFGRIGFVYVAAIEKGNKIQYELHENRQSLLLWSEDLIRQIIEINKQLTLTLEEEKNLNKNIQMFREKLYQIPEEE